MSKRGRVAVWVSGRRSSIAVAGALDRYSMRANKLRSDVARRAIDRRKALLRRVATATQK